MFSFHKFWIMQLWLRSIFIIILLLPSSIQWSLQECKASWIDGPHGDKEYLSSSDVWWAPEVAILLDWTLALTTPSNQRTMIRLVDVGIRCRHTTNMNKDLSNGWRWRLQGTFDGGMDFGRQGWSRPSVATQRLRDLRWEALDEKAFAILLGPERSEADEILGHQSKAVNVNRSKGIAGVWVSGDGSITWWAEDPTRQWPI